MEMDDGGVSPVAGLWQNPSALLQVQLQPRITAARGGKSALDGEFYHSWELTTVTRCSFPLGRDSPSGTS